MRLNKGTPVWVRAGCIWSALTIFLAMPPASTAAGSSRAIVAWGANGSGQCSVTPPNEDFVAVSGGSEHSLGLRSDGSISAWGDNTFGQCDVPSPNEGFVAVACGNWHSLALRVDGSIVAWGWNQHGQCNVPEPNANFISVAAGGWHSLGLRAGGTVAAWGWNNHGQCDVPAPNNGFIAIEGGADHSVALKENGSIVAWGDNAYGQCSVPSPNVGYIAITAGAEHCLGLKGDGSIVAWGRNDVGQCATPVPNTGFVAIAGGANHSIALRARGSVAVWGANQAGQSQTPVPNRGFCAVGAGALHTLGVQATHAFIAYETVPFAVRQVNLDSEEFVAAFRSRSWHPGGAGRYLAFDGRGDLWVTDNIPQAIQRMDGQGVAIETFPVDSPHNVGDIEYHPGKNRLFLITRPGPSGSLNRLVEIDPNNPAQQLTRLTWGNEFEACYISIDPSGNLAITSWTGGNAVRVYDANTFALLGAAPRPPGGGNLTGIAFLGDYFYVACNTYPTARIHKYRRSDNAYVGPVGPVFAYAIAGLEPASKQSLWMAHNFLVEEIDVGTGAILRALPDGGITSGGGHDIELGSYIPLRGDTNCSAIVDFDDIDPFVLALSGEDAYLAAYPDCDWLLADCNGDGTVDFDDIDSFVARLGL